MQTNFLIQDTLMFSYKCFTNMSFEITLLTKWQLSSLFVSSNLYHYLSCSFAILCFYYSY